MRTGCPITTFGHDREMPASPVLPTAPPVIPQVFSGNPERKTFYLLSPTLFGHYAQNDIFYERTSTQVKR